MNRSDPANQQGIPIFRRAAVPLFLFFVVLALYAQAVNYEFIYDDLRLIVDPSAPRNVGDILGVFAEGHWEGLPYYRPIARLTIVFQKYLHSNNPAPYHALNALLMGIFALLIWLLFQQPRMAIRQWPAAVGAALVAIHPVASCTVYPICSGRETLLPAIFIVAAVTAFMRPGRLWYGIAMGLFGVSLLCKEQAVITPGLFLLADSLGFSHAAPIRGISGWMRRYLAVVGILLAYFLVRWLVLHGYEQIQLAVVDHPTVPVLSYLYALQMTIVPFVQLVYEPPADIWRAGSQWRILVCLAVLIGFGALIFFHWSAVSNRVFFWLGWFVLALLPTANLLHQEAPFAERYMLLSLVAVVGLAVMLASQYCERMPAQYIFVTFALIVLIACSWISLKRGQHFANEIRFQSQWVHTNPKSDQAHRGLGWALLQKNRSDEAIAHLGESLRLNPRGVPAHINLGTAYLRLGEPQKSLPYFKAAVQLMPSNAEAHNNLALVLAALGERSKAINHYKTALRIDPNYSEAHNNLGVVMAQQGDLGNATEHFQQAIRLDPDNAEAHNNLANALATQGELGRAALHFRLALRINPDYEAARNGLKNVQGEIRQRAE